MVLGLLVVAIGIACVALVAQGARASRESGGVAAFDAAALEESEGDRAGAASGDLAHDASNFATFI